MTRRALEFVEQSVMASRYQRAGDSQCEQITPDFIQPAEEILGRGRPRYPPGNAHIVKTTRNCALPLISRA